MARVDLKCGCGYMFFVGDAQFKAPGGVKCPACLAPVKAPGGAAPAAKAAAPKAPPRPAPEEASVPFDAVPAAGASKKLLYIVGGSVGAVILVLVVILIVVLARPSVDYDKQAELAQEQRRKRYQEISSSKGGGSALPAPAPAPAPAAPVKPVAPAAKAPRSTEYKPIGADPKPASPATPAPATPPAPAPAKAPGTAAAVNADLLGRLRSDVLPLHPFYVNLVLSPAEKARLDGMAASGRGTPEDADFAQAVLTGGKLKAILDEIGAIGQQLPTLERLSTENLPVDRITRNEGSPALNCRILEEGPDFVKVSRMTANGVGGQMTIRRDTIAGIEKGKGIGAEFSTRWETAQKGSIATLVELLIWCKSSNLTGQAKLVAFTIVKSDPSNTQARVEAGLPADPVKHQEDVSKGGIIVYQGKNWLAKELKDKLLADGYALMDGRWYSKKEKMIVVPGLFRYERQQDKPVNFGGTAPMCHDTDIIYTKVAEPSPGQPLETSEERFIRRFYAPQMTTSLTDLIPPGIVAPASTPENQIRLNVDVGKPVAGTVMKGEVTIQVPVGAPILEASVITTAEVKAGGSIVVYLSTGTGEGEKRTKLYMCDPKESQSHVIPSELVRGLTEVNLVAVIEALAAYTPKVERRRVRTAVYKGKILSSPAIDIVHHRLIPDYKAVLFPSNNNTIEVFRLRLALADPSPALDKLFTANSEILRYPAAGNR